MQTYESAFDFEGLSFLAHQRPVTVGILDNGWVYVVLCSLRMLVMYALKKLELIAELCPEAFRCKSDSCGLPIHYASSKKAKGCDEEVLRYWYLNTPNRWVLMLGHSVYLGIVFWKRSFACCCCWFCSRKNTELIWGEWVTYRSCIFLQDNEIQDKDRILALHPFGIYGRAEAEEDEMGKTLSHLIFRITKDVEMIERNLYFPLFFWHVIQTRPWMASTATASCNCNET